MGRLEVGFRELNCVGCSTSNGGLVVASTTSPTFSSPEGEGFPPSPMETLTLVPLSPLSEFRTNGSRGMVDEGPLDREPIVALLVCRGPVTNDALGALCQDARLRLLRATELTRDWVVVAQRLAATIVVCDGDPFGALTLAMTAGIATAIVLVIAPEDEACRSDLVAAGAAACLEMPVGSEELEAVLAKLAGRRGIVHFDQRLDGFLDPLGRTVRRHHRVLRLSPREFELLYCLSARDGRPTSRGALLANLWPNRRDSRSSEALLEFHVSQLRRKLARIGLSRAVQTVRGFGYVIGRTP